MESKTILLKNAVIIDPTSSHHLQKRDILIANDHIEKIGDALDNGEAEVFEAENLHISPGWCDLRASFGDPGFEEREDIESGIHAAIYGGFTAVALSPDTNPPLDSKADIEYIYKRAETYPVNLYPYGTLSKNQEGRELSEMYDMYSAGAVGFSQGKYNSPGSGIIKLAMQYARSFAPPLHLLALDHEIAKGGQMHEGEVSTILGLKGIPVLSDEIAMQRLFSLARYADTSLHLMAISSATAVDILKSWKAQNQKFTADVAVANLYFNEEELHTYDTRFKLLPPLRSELDRQALIQALKSDLIQVITSDHDPRDIESKKCEFDHAAFGAIGLESFIGALLKATENELSLSRIIELIAINPRKVLELYIPSIEEGNPAELTFFDPVKEWVFGREHIQSKSANSPFLGRAMKGRALGIFNNGMMVWMANS